MSWDLIDFSKNKNDYNIARELWKYKMYKWKRGTLFNVQPEGKKGE